MRVNLISFQDKAVKELRLDIADALDSYRRRQRTQVVSLQAPTGAGKTIIAAALIESIYYGLTLADGSTFDAQPETTGTEEQEQQNNQQNGQQPPEGWEDFYNYFFGNRGWGWGN